MSDTSQPAFQETSMTGGFLVKLFGGLAIGSVAFYMAYRTPVDPTLAVKPPSAPSKTTASAQTDTLRGIARQLALLTPGIERHQRVLSLADQAKLEDFPALMSELNGNATDRQALSLAWADRDPQGFFAWLKVQYLPGSDATGLYSGTLFATWASKDPAAALQAAKAVAHLPAFRVSGWDVFAGAYTANSQTALPLLKELGPTPPGFGFPDALWKTSPEGLIKDITKQMPTVDRYLALALSAPMAAWAARAPAEVLAWLDTQPQSAWQFLLNESTLPLLAQADPAKISGMVMKIPQAPDREKAVVAAAMGWAKVDAASALTFLANNGGTRRRKGLEDLAYDLLLAKQGLQLEAAINAMQPGTAKNAAMQAVGKQYLDVDPDAASAWISRLPADENRNQLVATIAPRWAETLPAKAIEFFNAQPRGNAVLDSALENFTYKLAPYDVESAVDLALAQKPEHRDPYIRNIFSSLGRETQFDDVATALAMLPDDRARDQALAIVLSGFATGQQDVQNLTTWPEPTPELRDYFIKFIQNSPLIPKDEGEAAIAIFNEQAAAEKAGNAGEVGQEPKAN